MAVCSNDNDSDGYAPTTTGGCPVVLDCDDFSATVSPNDYETVGDDQDQDCDGLDLLRRWYQDDIFAPTVWNDVGTVTRANNTIKVGAAGAAASSSYRDLSINRVYGGTGVMLDIEAGTGSCALKLTTAPYGAATPTTTHLSSTLPTSGTT